MRGRALFVLLLFLCSIPVARSHAATGICDSNGIQTAGTRNKEQLATPKARFDILFGQMKANRDGYIHAIWATVGFLIMSIGWLLTSGQAGSFLHKQERARRYAHYIIQIIAILHIVTLLHYSHVSSALMETMRTLGYIEKNALDAYLSRYEISMINALFSTLINLTLFYFLDKLIIETAENGQGDPNPGRTGSTS